ncbi:MAG: helicase/exodeoxyribonuclease subunit [Polaromonas sp.]|nr:helicase/exodeoxyribonuclease subunit [Polaromonas sp.]
MTAAYECNGRPVSADAFYAIACDPRRSVAVEACAGAGKTWMLVSRIVRALLDGANGPPHADGSAREPVRPQEILAITFTKKAAGEMRERLDEWLQKFTHADDATLRQELAMRGVSSQISPQASQDMRRQLSNLYRTLLASGRAVQIRTFHSWFAALLRSAPVAVLHRLGMPANYELLEDDAPARALVWRPFYAALAADALLKADFEALVSGHGRFQADKALQAALDKRTEFLLADEKGVVDASVQPFDVQFPAFAGLAFPQAALGTPLAKSIWLERARELAAEKNKTPQKAAAAVIDAFAVSDLSARCDMLRKAFFVAGDDRLTQNLAKFSPAQDAEAELQALCQARVQHEAWLHQQRMARLTRLLIAQYTQLKRAHGWIDMNDVERAALVMLGDPVLAGWVQERLDARIKHLMIDEFQDTNPLQWQALSSWLSGYGGAGAAPSVFLVGDPKQSIYRFRRAEPQVFRAAQAFVVEGLGGDLLSCDHTRRNALAVIGCVNAVMGQARVVDGYDGFRDHTTDSTRAGSTHCLPPIARNRAGDADDQPGAWRDSLTTPRELPEETLRTLEARQAADWIASQLQAGLQPSGVMVLSRRRAGLLPLQQALRALNVPAQIGEKIDLIDCCEVLDMVALLDVLVSPQHDLSLARALRSPLFGLPDTSLVQLALLKRELNLPWYELLQKTELLAQELQGLGTVLTRWKGWLDSLPPHDALQAIYDDGDVLARFAAAAPASQRQTVLANLRALLGVALGRDGGRYATPYGLVRALKAGGLQAPVAVNPGAVRLLTIHGAKGLEAEAVLLLDTDTAPRHADTMGVLVDWPGEAAAPRKLVFLLSEVRPPACAMPALAAEQAARQREELNALYVAMTRARHTLAISSIEPHRPTPDSWWRRLQERVAALDMAPGLESVALRVDTGATGLAPAGEPPAGALADVFHLPELPVLAGTKTLAPPADALAPEDPANARLGKAMHRLLEWGGPWTPAHVVAVGREFRLSPAQAAKALALAQCIVQGAGAWAWCDDAVAWQANEVDLVYRGQPLRLDRLVQRKDAGHEGQWWVLDYKSAPQPELQPALLAQMRTYRAAVQLIYPRSVVKAAFLTGLGTMVELG